jgi:hypothetical protein
MSEDGRMFGSTPKVKSDGSASTYYEIDIPVNKVMLITPTEGMPLSDFVSGRVRVEVKDIIRHALNNDFDKGNIFKALVRLGKKDGASIVYDINKMRFFLDELEKELVNE